MSTEDRLAGHVLGGQDLATFLRRATITDRDSATTGTVSLLLTGSEEVTSGVHCLPGVWPNVTDSVWCLKTASDLLVVGIRVAAATSLVGRRTTNSTPVTTTTLVSDTEMALWPTVNTRYKLEGHIIYTSPAAADMEFAFDYPDTGGTEFVWTAGGVSIATSSGAGEYISNTANLLAPDFTFQYGGAEAFVLSLQLRGSLHMGTDAGQLIPRYSVRVNNATGLVVYKHSWIELIRMEG